MLTGILVVLVRYTYHTGLELRRLAVKNIGRLDSILDYTDRSVEETHEVTAFKGLTWLCPTSASVPTSLFPQRRL
jgi:hypothetical protein